MNAIQGFLFVGAGGFYQANILVIFIILYFIILTLLEKY